MLQKMVENGGNCENSNRIKVDFIINWLIKLVVIESSKSTVKIVDQTN